MKTTKTLVWLLLLVAAYRVNAQCVWYYPTYEGGGTYSFAASLDSINPNAQYNWTFDDGGSATGPNVQHTFTTAGLHSWCLNFNGSCTTTICDTAYVDPCSWPVSVSYTEGDTLVTFGMGGAQPGWTYSWSFPNGTPATSTAANPTIAFPGPGYYTGQVTVNTPGGCTFTLGASANVSSIHNTGSCNPWAYAYNQNHGLVNFVAAADSTPAATYQWDFGDGTGSNLQNPSHTYTASGTYTYCFDYSGPLCSGSICRTVQVDVCQFVSSISVINTTGTTITLAVDGALPGSTYQWSIAGGTPSTPTQANPAVTFPAYGAYSASVTVTSPSGCIKQLSGNVRVNDFCNVHTVVYQNGGGDTYFAAYADTLAYQGTYTWDFGDGATGTGQYPFHSYQSNGTYVYCVDYNIPSAGCSGTYCDTVYVDICDLNAFIFPYQQGNGTNYSFRVYADSLSMWTYNWNFGTGQPATSTDAYPVVTFPGPGTYNISVDYVAHNGCTGTLTYTLVVTSQQISPCDSLFYTNVTANYLSVTLANTPNPQATYYWEFGDGDSTVGTSSTHHYTALGTYNVCLTVTAPGCVSSLCRTINVQNIFNYTITGYVTKDSVSYNVCDAYVFLISDSSGYLTAIDTFDMSADTGSCHSHFYFTDLPQGTYYVKAALLPGDVDYAGFLPTYSLQQLNWADANPIVFTGNNYQEHILVNLIPGVNPGGPAFVGGWVTQGAGLGIGGGADETRAVGDPLAGVQINLLNSAGQPVAYTYSNGTGQFSFGNLALGTYKIYAEALNKTPIELTFTLTQNNPSVQNVVIEVNSNSAVATAIEELQGLFVEGLMPNPTTDMATLAVTVKQSAEATLTVRSLTGSVVNSRQLQLTTGLNNIAVSLANQPSGIYTIELAGASGNRVLKLVKTQ